MGTHAILEYLQAVESAAVTGNALTRRYVWPKDETLGIAYYEPAARHLCWLNNKDPDERCEFVGEAGVVDTAANKVVYWVPRWETLVARLKEFDTHFLALLHTMEERRALLNQIRPEGSSGGAPDGAPG